MELGLGRTEQTFAPALLTLADENNPRLLRVYIEEAPRLPREREALQRFVDLSGTVLEEGGTLAETADRTFKKRRKELADAIADPNIARAFRTIVAFDHSDWTRALGNAVSHAFPENENAMRQSFADLERVADANRALKRGDGSSLVQLAVDQGILLDVAKKLSLFLIDDEWSYPQNAPQLAESLLRWHELGLRQEPQAMALA